MLAYIARRLLLMIPTIFGIMLVSFAIVQFVPGGPVERERGFVIHTADYATSDSTVPVGEGIALTPTREVREAIADAEAVVFDFNHPLAGMAVTFEVQLIGVL